MSLLSSLRKDKQEPAADEGAFISRAEEESNAARSRGAGKRKQSKAASPSAEAVLPEKKRARRRLVGAVALVLAAVISLPMILDSEPKPLADDIAIQIPSRDKAPEAGSNPSSAASAPLPKKAVPAAPEPDEEIVEPAPTAAPTRVAANIPAKQQEADKAAVNPAAEPKSATPPAHADKPIAVAMPKSAHDASKAEPAHKADAKPAAAHIAVNDDAARALALLQGKGVPDHAAAKPASDHKAGHVVYQVAALASKDKIDELQQRLRQAGITSHTQKVATESGTRTRVRVGPFASQEEAERVHAKLVKLGLNASPVPMNP